MITVHADGHHLQNPRAELAGGELVPPYEAPVRAERVLDAIHRSGLGEVIEPRSFPLDPLLRVHDPGYLRFLETAWDRWVAVGNEGEAIASVWPARNQLFRRPDHVEGQLGWYALSAETSIGPGTWSAARGAAEVALTAVERLSGEPAIFGLTRPPGHHAARDLFGGYCFLNNAAVAVQAVLDVGATRVAVLDVDFHHGNGTQALFYDRDDVLFLSLHGDPGRAFPYFSGYADETGVGRGEGWTVNYPLPEGTGWDRWGVALEDACRRISSTGAEALVVSLGVDTYFDDPICFFTLERDDYRRLGERLRATGIPTLFLLEGGYAVDAIGENVVAVLAGFEGG